MSEIWKNHKGKIIAGLIMGIIVLVLALSGVFSKSEETKSEESKKQEIKKNVGESCEESIDCQTGLNCSGGFCVFPKDFGENCTRNSDCINGTTCDTDYKQCLNKPELTFRPLDCGFKDDFQGYYSFSGPGTNDFCRKVGNPPFEACIVKGLSDNQYVKRGETVYVSGIPYTVPVKTTTDVSTTDSSLGTRIPLKQTDQCYNGGLLRGNKQIGQSCNATSECSGSPLNLQCCNGICSLFCLS